MASTKSYCYPFKVFTAYFTTNSSFLIIKILVIIAKIPYSYCYSSLVIRNLVSSFMVFARSLSSFIGYIEVIARIPFMDFKATSNIRNFNSFKVINFHRGSSNLVIVSIISY